MRILMSSHNIGGVWTYSLELARALAPLGIEVHLASMGTAMTAHHRRDAGACGNVILHESKFRLEWMEDPWQDVERAGEWLLELEQRYAPEVVHLNGYSHGALPFQAPKLVVAHSCVVKWFQAVLGTEPPDCFREYRRRVAQGLRCADHVVAPSAAMLASVRENFGSPASSEVIYNGRSDAAFHPPSAGGKLPYVFAAGRCWDEGKNIATLDAAAPHIVWPVYCAGENAHRRRSAAVKTPHIRCLGALEDADMAHWLGQASIYALPARYEPFGLSILEAALGGCALVLGDIPSLRELWQQAAVFVDPNDSAALAATINILIQHPVSRSEWAARALARARTYSPLRMAQAYADAYFRLLTRQRPQVAAAPSLVG
jgi:glycogen synthase